MIEVDKNKLMKELAKKARENFDAAEEAGRFSKDHTNSEELKQEGKYDTRAIEAGYLAGAQAKRVEELKLELQLIEELSPKAFKAGEAIGPGALVELELNDRVQTYFLCNTAGGTLLTLNDKSVLVISVFSPLGNGMLDYHEGDSFELETPKETRQYLVRSVK